MSSVQCTAGRGKFWLRVALDDQCGGVIIAEDREGTPFELPFDLSGLNNAWSRFFFSECFRGGAGSKRGTVLRGFGSCKFDIGYSFTVEGRLTAGCVVKLDA